MYGVGLMPCVLFLGALVAIPALSALAHEIGAADSEIPIVVSAALVTVAIAQLFTGLLADRYSRRPVVLAGALVGSSSARDLLPCA